MVPPTTPTPLTSRHKRALRLGRPGAAGASADHAEGAEPAGGEGAAREAAVLAALRWKRPEGNAQLVVGMADGAVAVKDVGSWRDVDRLEDAGGPVSAVCLVRLRYVNPETGAMKKTWQLVTGTQNGRLRAWSRDAKPPPPPPPPEEEGEEGAGEPAPEPAPEPEEEGKEVEEAAEAEEPPPPPAWHLWTDVFPEPNPGAFGSDGYGPRITAMASFDATWDDWRPDGDPGAPGDETEAVDEDAAVEEDAEEPLGAAEEGKLPEPPRPEPFTVLVVANAAGGVVLYDTHTWEVLPCPQLRHAEAVSALLVMPRLPNPPAGEDGAAPPPLPMYAKRCRIVTASTDKAMCVWGQPKRGREPACVQLGKQSAAAMSLAPWRGAFASGHGDGSVALWTCATNASGDDVYTVAYRLNASSPVRSLLVAGEDDNKVTAGDGNGSLTMWKYFGEEAGPRLSTLPWKLMRTTPAFPSCKDAAVVALVACGVDFVVAGDGAHVWR